MNETLITTLDLRKSVSTREVADWIGLPIRTVQDYARRGLIPGAFQVQKRGQWRFKTKQLNIWWANQGLSHP